MTDDTKTVEEWLGRVRQGFFANGGIDDDWLKEQIRRIQRASAQRQREADLQYWAEINRERYAAAPLWTDEDQRRKASASDVIDDHLSEDGEGPKQ